MGIFARLRESRRQRVFDRAFVAAARSQFAEGVLSYDTLQDCLRGAENKEGMKQARRQLMCDPNMLGGIKDWDWEAIYAWFIEYIVPALKIILPMLLVLTPNPCPDEE